MSEDTQEEYHHEEDLTTSSEERWEYIGTLLSGVTILSADALILGAAYGIFSLSAIGQAWFVLYSTLVLMAATWVFGKETLQAVKEARK